MLYCLHNTEEKVKKIIGPHTCRSCDAYVIQVVNEGKDPKAFPQTCPYCTDSLQAAEAHVAAWTKDKEAREKRIADFKEACE